MNVLWRTLGLYAGTWTLTLAALVYWEFRSHHAVLEDLMYLKAEMLHDNAWALQYRVGGHGGFLSYGAVWLVGLAGLAVTGRRWRGLLDALRQAATCDPLTGLWNRRELMRKLDHEMPVPCAMVIPWQ